MRAIRCYAQFGATGPKIVKLPRAGLRVDLTPTNRSGHCADTFKCTVTGCELVVFRTDGDMAGKGWGNEYNFRWSDRSSFSGTIKVGPYKGTGKKTVRLPSTGLYVDMSQANTPGTAWKAMFNSMVIGSQLMVWRAHATDSQVWHLQTAQNRFLAANPDGTLFTCGSDDGWNPATEVIMATVGPGTVSLQSAHTGKYMVAEENGKVLWNRDACGPCKYMGAGRHATEGVRPLRVSHCLPSVLPSFFSTLRFSSFVFTIWCLPNLPGLHPTVFPTYCYHAQPHPHASCTPAAAAAPPGTGESFQLEDHGGGNAISLKSAHGKYLCSANNFKVAANRDVAGAWETFTRTRCAAGGWDHDLELPYSLITAEVRAAADTDGDGKISAAEFAALDKDGDGRLSAAEIKSANKGAIAQAKKDEEAAATTIQSNFRGFLARKKLPWTRA